MRGRKDVPPNNYFPKDQSDLKMIKVYYGPTFPIIEPTSGSLRFLVILKVYVLGVHIEFVCHHHKSTVKDQSSA